MKPAGKLFFLALTIIMVVGLFALAGCSSAAPTSPGKGMTITIGNGLNPPTGSAPAPTATTAPAPPKTTAPAPAPTVTPFMTFTTAPDNPQIIMASTTSTRDSGLMDILIPIFEKETGYKIKPVYVGTGAAIQLGQQGNADVVLVHAPSLEVPFVNSGVGVYRTLVMHNDFIIVGPSKDPAGIKGMTSATDAFKKIADTKSTFYSRGDKSGTDTAEKAIWKKVGVTVADGSSNNPSWYVEGGTGTGMLDLLRIASEKNGYAITDRSTYLANKSVLSLDILVQGDPSLLNVYHVICVNQLLFPKVNFSGAKIFSDFMVSAEAQSIIASFGKDKYGQALFYADAGKPESALGSF
jgi:tungstate transport system substrate-binding protein